jgi:hypothetical protein
MKTKQTAVESIKTTFFHYAESYPYFSEQEKWVITKEELFEVLQQAKQMEKQQIIDAYYNGTTDEIKTKDELLFEAEHFYKETYGNEQR